MSRRRRRSTGCAAWSTSCRRICRSAGSTTARPRWAALAASLKERHGIAAGTHVTSGALLGEIARIADATTADLIVLGARGSSLVRHFVLGSTAERLVSTCTRPMLVVRQIAHEPIPKRPRAGRLLRRIGGLAARRGHPGARRADPPPSRVRGAVRRQASHRRRARGRAARVPQARRERGERPDGGASRRCRSRAGERAHADPARRRCRQDRRAGAGGRLRPRSSSARGARAGSSTSFSAASRAARWPNRRPTCSSCRPGRSRRVGPSPRLNRLRGRRRSGAVLRRLVGVSPLAAAAARKHRPPDDEDQQHTGAECFQQNDPHDPRFRCAPGALAAAPILGTLLAGRDVVAARRLLEHAAAATGRRTGGRDARAGQRCRRRRRPAETTWPRRTIERQRARWVAVRWSDLPGWDGDRLRRLLDRLPAQLRAAGAGLARHLREARAQASAPARRKRRRRARLAAARSCRPYRVESTERDAVGLATGYFEPLVEARASRGPAFASPCTGRRPTSRREALLDAPAIETLPAAQKSLRGREIAWVRDRLDALVLQVQGSGRLRFADERAAARRRSFASPTPATTTSRTVGRPLADRAGRAAPDEASWPAIRAWARRNPERVDEMLRSNPRVVFFREEPLPDPALGPRGAQGVPLSPGRSIAVDPQSVPYGTPVWLDTTEPLSASRCAAWWSPRTPARRSSARCAPTTSGAGATRPRPPPAA